MQENKRNYRILAILFTGVLMGALDISIVGPAIPSISRTIRLTNHDLSWIFSVYILFNLVGVSLMARLSDFYGRRLIYILSVLIFGLGSLVVAFSHDLTWLLIGRGIQGIGSSGIFPVASAVIGDVFPFEKRGRAMGLIGAVFGIAFILGPFIAGFILMFFEWNALFLINIPVAILVIIFSWFYLPSSRTEGASKLDWSGIVLLAIILSCFTLVMNNLDPLDIPGSLLAWPYLPMILVCFILTPLLVINEYYQKDPVFNIRLFRNRQVRMIGLISFGFGIFQSSIVFLPMVGVDLFKVTPSQASFMLLPVVIATAVGSPLNGRLVDRIGSRPVIIAGLLMAAVGLFLIGLMAKSTWLFYLSEALFGMGLGIRASFNYVVLNEADVKDRASTQGMLIIFISIGQLTGATILGMLSSTFPAGMSGYRTAFLIFSGIAASLIILSLFLKSRKQEAGSAR